MTRTLAILALALASCSTGGITVNQTKLDEALHRLKAIQTELEEIDRRQYALEKQRNVDSRESFDQRKALNDRLEEVRIGLESVVAILQRDYGLAPMSRAPRPLVTPTPNFPAAQRYP